MIKSSFIQASAGTGKTFRIMEILSDLIKENKNSKKNPLLSTLVLTFSEKAAGELKARLKQKLNELCEKDSSFFVYLKELDQVNISTIHGFCNMILQEYPIETNSLDSVALTTTIDIVKKELYLTKRSSWNGRDPNSLSEDLTITDFLKKEDQIIKTTSWILADTKNYSTENTENQLSAQTLVQTLKTKSKEWYSFVAEIKNGIDDPNFLKLYEGVQKVYPTWKQLWTEFIFILENITSVTDITIINFLSTISNMQRSGKDSDLTFWDYFLLEGGFLVTKTRIPPKKTQATISEFVSQLNHHLPIQNIDWSGDRFVQSTVEKLIENTKEHLAIGEEITYDQMILKLRDAIRTNDILLKELRERFNICILDEFQDTDKNQYEIFSKIFLEDAEPGRALICIGDPKQSIYSFRGADIGVYLDASSNIQIQNPNDKNKNNLTINFRSVAELIKGYNHIFYDYATKDQSENGKTNFFPILEPGYSEKDYEYIPVDVPEEDSIRYKLENKPHTNPVRIQVFNEEFTDKDSAKASWRERIISEIFQLTNNDGFSYFKRNKYSNEFQKTQLRLKDIAILCSTNRETEEIESELKRFEIPCSIYKRRGIYQSEEAYQIENLLECLLKPNSPESYRKILFSDFFQIPPNDLDYFNEHSIDSYEKRKIDKWLTFINKGSFAKFFQSVIKETKVFWTNNESQLYWERKQTNYRQIFQKLLEFQLRDRKGLSEILAELRRLISETTNAEEEPLFDRETEEDAVQILTIHASKGLEWPVIFLYYYKTENKFKPYEYPLESAAAKRSWILNLWEKEENKDAKRRHFLNEQRRLLYVALTRPNVLLYLPKQKWISRSFEAYNEILFHEIERIYNKEDLKNSPYFLWENCDKNSQEFVSKKQNHTKLTKDHFHHIHYSNHLSLGKKNFEHSYTKLKFTLFSKETKERTITPKLEGQLKSSASVGIFLHSILENTEFSIFQMPIDKMRKHPAWLDSYQSTIRGIDINLIATTPDKVENLTLNLLHKVMNTQISIGTKSLKLSEITEDQKTVELNFQVYFPEISKQTPILYDHFLKGAIDLIFINDGKYYIADYKSDLLENNDYNPENLTQEIKFKGYDIQKDLYALVLFRYLKSLFGETEAIAKFGGVFYFFLRGMGEVEGHGIHSDLEWNLERINVIQTNLLIWMEQIEARDHNEI
ncbi:UvrD-helicase domain-containing protein [Leptospira sp. 96542]|nr:UvrD-helicase domain-containing protein [Leptospira sp. 96542]